MAKKPGKVGVRTRRIAIDDNTRAKIQTTQIQKRLTDHILGKIELSASQVTAALGLLKKTLPDLQAIEAHTTVEQQQRVINAEPLSEAEFIDRYGVETPKRPPESIN